MDVMSGTLFFGYAAAAYVALRYLYYLLLPSSFQPKGKHCYITGGSQGLGKSLAIQLAQQGAHVTIIARKEHILKEALAEIEAARANPSVQKVNYVVADVCSKQDSVRAIKEATDKMGGRVPEYVFCIAGSSTPGFFLEMDDSIFEQSIRLNYLGTLYTLRETAKLMVQKNIRGKLVLCSTLAAFNGFIGKLIFARFHEEGYSSYSPSKYAVRGLADVLRQEMQLYGIEVHALFPGSIATAGFEEENKIKPRVTAQIEGNDAMTPDAVAKASLDGIRKGYFYITCELIGEILQAGSLGGNPCNHYLTHSIMTVLSWIVFPVLRLYTDALVRREGLILKSKHASKKD